MECEAGFFGPWLMSFLTGMSGCYFIGRKSTSGVVTRMSMVLSEWIITAIYIYISRLDTSPKIGEINQLTS